MSQPPRHHRQTLLPQIGSVGQERLRKSRIAILGCGALGTVAAEQLVRAGVGFIRIIDRDVVEATNLQRQTLFTEADAIAGTPKAIAAATRLRAIDSSIQIDARVHDVDAENIEALLSLVDAARFDVVIDGTDNVETRYLLNDVCVKHNLPWIYGACVGVEGRVMTILPGKSACLRCIFPNPPAAGELPTCDTAGVLAPAAAIVASLQVVAAMKVLLDGELLTGTTLTRINAWDQTIRTTSTSDARDPNCPACGKRRFEFLEGTRRCAIGLCGRNTVQIRPPRGAVSATLLQDVSQKLARITPTQSTAHLLRFQASESIELTLFSDGRLLVQGTTDHAVARSMYARFVGS